jgi:hypothetical protein
MERNRPLYDKGKGISTSCNIALELKPVGRNLVAYLEIYSNLFWQHIPR